jgi:hypothetical protein
MVSQSHTETNGRSKQHRPLLEVRFDTIPHQDSIMGEQKAYKAPGYSDVTMTLAFDGKCLEATKLYQVCELELAVP